MLAAVALLLGQAAPTPAQSHRLEWVRQEDGSYWTDFDDGQRQINASCIVATKVSCTIVRTTGRDHIAVRRFEGDRLPLYSIGLLADPAGYGCDLIPATGTIIEQIDSGQTGVPPVARKVTSKGGATWTGQDVRRLGANYFACVPLLDSLLLSK